MSESEITIDVPLFDQAAEGLKSNGEFKTSVDEQGMSAMMKSVVDGLLEATADKVDAKVPSMDVVIEGERGKVNGQVLINRPINASIELGIVLENNDARPGELRLANLTVDQRGKGIKDKLALKAVGLEGRVRQVLQDPNKALKQALNAQLNSRGAEVTGLYLRFQEETLDVALTGGKLQ